MPIMDTLAISIFFIIPIPPMLIIHILPGMRRRNAPVWNPATLLWSPFLRRLAPLDAIGCKNLRQFARTRKPGDLPIHRLGKIDGFGLHGPADRPVLGERVFGIDNFDR